MSEKRFSKTEKLQHLDDEVIIVVDNANKEWKGHVLNIVDKLNELNDERMMYRTTIDKRIVELEEENKQLRKELGDCEKFRYSVFKGMEKTLEEKKNDDGGFQVWEVPPIPQGKRISFTTNNDGGDE